MPRLAYLGPPGTFTEEAALRYRPDADLIAYSTEGSVVAAVESGEAEQGVLAIENSLEGSVTRTIDALIHDSQLYIKGEVILAIEHCLIVRPGTKAGDVSVIRAHPQALNQCRKFIERRYPQVRQEASLSNAAAVEEILRIEGGAAIAGARAAEIHGGQVLERNIADNEHNKTRFVVLARADGQPTGRDKTSIAFTVPHDQPGTLVDVLHEFSDRAINLTKLESRPTKERLGEYCFFIDIEGHVDDTEVGHAIAGLRTKILDVRVMGSYPRAEPA